MKQKIINLYEFHELSHEQQEKVINNNRFINDDDFELYVSDEFCMGEIWESGFIDAQPNYSLNYSQGDGACFDCDEFDFDLLLKDWQHKHKNWIINIIKDFCSCEISRNHFATYYCHSKTRYFEINTYQVEGNYTDRKHIIEAIQDADNYIENLRYELSKNLTARLYEQLEWLRDDEQIKETLISNEYYFNGDTLEIEY